MASNNITHDPLYRHAVELALKGEFNAAIDKFRVLESAMPNSPEAACWIAELLMPTNPGEALRLIEATLRMDSTFIETYRMRSHCSKRLGRWGEALRSEEHYLRLRELSVRQRRLIPDNLYRCIVTCSLLSAVGFSSDLLMHHLPTLTEDGLQTVFSYPSGDAEIAGRQSIDSFLALALSTLYRPAPVEGDSLPGSGDEPTGHLVSASYLGIFPDSFAIWEIYHWANTSQGQPARLLVQTHETVSMDDAPSPVVPPPLHRLPVTIALKPLASQRCLRSALSALTNFMLTVEVEGILGEGPVIKVSEYASVNLNIISYVIDFSHSGMRTLNHLLLLLLQSPGADALESVHFSHSPRLMEYLRRKYALNTCSSYEVSIC